MTYKVTRSELSCQCGCGNNVTDEFFHKINAARLLAKTPFVITSGARCHVHNERVGGSPTSAHQVGLAADIACTDNRVRFKIINALMAVGFTRIGIGENFIHVDMAECEIKRANVIWTYYKEK